MYSGVEGVTMSLLNLALDTASLRQKAHANNIANANVMGYKPVQVNFESQLQEVRQTLQEGGAVNLSALNGISPQLEEISAGYQGPQGIEIDSEIAKLSENAVQYQALIKGLNKELSILSMAISEGKYK
jgi:flagellar basal-body rod protein FlgB